MSRQPPRYILPEDAIFLREATKRACDRAKASTDDERDTIAESVLWISRSGFARLSDGTINCDALAEAAVLRFWNASHLPAMSRNAVLQAAV